MELVATVDAPGRAARPRRDDEAHQEQAGVGVLTTAKIKAQSASAYTTYLESRAAPSERGDYYLKDGNVVEAPGRWVLGPLGTAALGLDGVDAPLTAEAFSAVMNGNHP